MIFHQSLDRRGYYGRESDPVRLRHLLKYRLVGVAETAYNPDRVPIDVVLLQSPLDEVLEILIDKVTDIFAGVVSFQDLRGERAEVLRRGIAAIDVLHHRHIINREVLGELAADRLRHKPFEEI